MSLNIISINGCNLFQKTNKTEVSLPKFGPSVTTEGSCDPKDQHLNITWGNKDEPHKLSINFELTNDNKSWYISSFTANIYIDEDFINATEHGK